MQNNDKMRMKPDGRTAKETDGSSFTSNIDFPGVAQEVFSQIAKSTSRVVKQAASILEEEVAAGIIAAKEIEEKMINTKELRSENKELLFSRFRRDAHDVVDIFVDMVGAAAKYGTSMTKKMVSITTPGNRDEVPVTGTAKLEMPPLQAGTSKEVPMVLENKSEKETDEFRIFSTDLVSSEGNRISSLNINFDPQTIKIAAGKTEKVNIKVTVPKKTAAGLYSGLVQATNMEQLQAILIVKVEL